MHYKNIYIPDHFDKETLEKLAEPNSNIIVRCWDGKACAGDCSICIAPKSSRAKCAKLILEYLNSKEFLARIL